MKDLKDTILREASDLQEYIRNAKVIDDASVKIEGMKNRYNKDKDVVKIVERILPLLDELRKTIKQK